jgi:hypothetical protein
MNIASYIQELESNSNSLLALLHTISAEKLNEKPENEWRILEIIEHIYRADRTFIQVISQKAEKHHDTEELRGSEKIERLLVGMRSRKVKAPDFLEPKGKFKSVSEFEEVFLRQRNSLKTYLESGTISDFTALFPHPFLGELTVTDWLYVVLHHTSRHREQIKDRLSLS